MPRSSTLVVLAAALAATVALPTAAAATPDGSGRVASARVRAAELRRRVDALAGRAERLAAAAERAQARADRLIASAAARQRELDGAEQTLGDAQDRYGRQVRELYMQGPLAPLEPLLYATDPATLAMASRATVETLRGDQRDLLGVELARGRV